MVFSEAKTVSLSDVISETALVNKNFRRKNKEVFCQTYDKSIFEN